MGLCSPRIFGYAQRRTQSLRARGSTLGDNRSLPHTPAATSVHVRFGPEPGAPLPAFERRRAPADQVDNLRRLVGGPYVPDRHCSFLHTSIGGVDRCRVGVVVELTYDRGVAELRDDSDRGWLRGTQVPSRRYRSHHQDTVSASRDQSGEYYRLWCRIEMRIRALDLSRFHAGEDQFASRILPGSIVSRDSVVYS